MNTLEQQQNILPEEQSINPPPLPVSSSENDEYKPMAGPISTWSLVECLLKHPKQVLHEISHGKQKQITMLQLGIACFCLLAYGLTVGLFSGGEQLWAAPVKITSGMLLSCLICFPSLYIFSCLSGLDLSVGELGGALTGSITIASLLLLGFAPVSWIFSESTESIMFMGSLHLILWGISICLGLRFLLSAYRHTYESNHTMLITWCIIFVFVCLQMTTTLRPILGTSDSFLPQEKMFFMQHWISSAQ